MKQIVLAISVFGLLGCGTAAQADTPQSQRPREDAREQRMEIEPEPEEQVRQLAPSVCSERSPHPECITSDLEICDARLRFAFHAIVHLEDRNEYWRRRF